MGERALILTGCNEAYARCLWQMLASAERAGLMLQHEFRVFDLGMKPATRERLVRRFPQATFMSFNFAAAPGHAAKLSGFAWKPMIIAEAADTWQGPMFWFDAATLFRTAIDRPLRSIAETGFWTLQGQTPLMGRADPRVLARLNLPPEILHLPERVAGACGFDTRQPVPGAFIKRWASLAQQAELITPADPDPSHRFDQTLFSALLLAAQWRGEIVLGTEEVDISSMRPISYLTTRNKLWPSLPTWLDLPARAWRRLWKALDRVGLRLEDFHKRRMRGFLRWWRERNRVAVAPGGGTPRGIETQPYTSLAHPFLIERDGAQWLFATRFAYAENRGRLVAMALGGNQQHPVEVDGEGVFGAFTTHVSFPHLFARGSALYMIPETAARRTVDLYACLEFPHRWRPAKRLLSGIDARNSMLLHHEGMDYLFTSVAGPDANRRLEIHMSPDVASAPFTSHPINSQHLYGHAPAGTGLCAGVLGPDPTGRLLRLMLTETTESCQWMEITTLTPEHFAEQKTTPPPGLPDGQGITHLSASTMGFAVGSAKGGF